MLIPGRRQSWAASLVLVVLVAGGFFGYRMHLAKLRASDPEVIHKLDRQLCDEYKHVWTSRGCVTRDERIAAVNAREARHLPELKRLEKQGWDAFYHQFSAVKTNGLFSRPFTSSDYDQLGDVRCRDGCVALHVRSDAFTSCPRGLSVFGTFHGQWDEVVGTARGSVPSLPANSEAVLVMKSSKPMAGTPWIDLTKVDCSK